MNAQDWLGRLDAGSVLVWHGMDSGGSWSQRLSRAPDSRYHSTLVLAHDGDPMGGATPETRTTVLDAAAAAAEIAQLLTTNGAPAVEPG